MDTIVYFYKKRGLTDPVIEPVGVKTYLLIRIAVDVGKEEWFGKKLERDPAEAEAVTAEDLTDTPDTSDTFLWRLRHPLQAVQRVKRDRMERQQENERRRREAQERKELSARLEKQRLDVEAAMRRLAGEVWELLGDTQECFCVYEDSVRKWLVEDTVIWEPREETLRESGERQRHSAAKMASLWRDCFPLEEFEGYFQQFWAEQLLPEAVHPHFVILGTAPCLFALLEKHARCMKSLRWMVPEADYNAELLEFAEDFYLEYGLAIALQPLEGSAAMRRLQLKCETPANILDFTGETHLTVSGVAEGSIWLDMCSVEEKQRRIALRGAGITYVSLKEKWKKAQKRCSCPIIP